MTDSRSGILLDSDFLIALAVDNESTHPRAKAIHVQIGDDKQYILDPVLYELATVTSRKFSHDFACRLLQKIQASDIQRLSIADLEPAIWKEFYVQKKKSTSFFDCANLVAARYFSMKIASFDNFYPKNMLAA